MISKFHQAVLKFSLVFCFCTSLFLANDVAGAIYDDFAGDQINTVLWNVQNSDGILSQSGGFLHANTPPNSCYGHLYSTRNFGGYFEFVLDYRDFQSNATVFNWNAPQIKLQINFLSSPGDWLEIFRGYCIDPLGNLNHCFISNGVINKSWTDTFRGLASSPSGSLKISRIGSTVTTYYNEGNDWVAVGFFSGASTGDVILVVGAYTGDDGIFHVSCDKIEVQPYTPEQEIDDVQDFFDNSVNNGTLTGVGSIPTSAKGKLLALKNMLDQAEYFIDNSFVSEACQQLKDAYLKTDGEPKPRDLVSGDGASELASMIQGLIANLGCQ